MAYVPRSDMPGVLLSALLLSAAGVIAGCDESLPPRLADPNTITADAHIVSGLITVQGGVPGGNAGVIEASVRNIYTEVLQDTPAVDIRCHIWLADYPDSAGEAVIDVSSLTQPSLIQGGMLTILPGSSVLFEKHWDYRSPGGTPFWEFIPLKDTADRAGPYKLSQPMNVIMTVTMRVFRDLPAYTLGPRFSTLQFEVR